MKMSGGLMRDRVKVICLNRMGVNVGRLTLKTDEQDSNYDAKGLFQKHKAFIKKIYPDAVKLKIVK